MGETTLQSSKVEIVNWKSQVAVMAMARVTEQGPAKKLWAGSLGQVYWLSGSWNSWCCKKSFKKHIVWHGDVFFVVKFQSELVSEKIPKPVQNDEPSWRRGQRWGPTPHGQGTRSDVKNRGWTVGLMKIIIGICEETDGFQAYHLFIVKIIQFWYDVKLFCVCFLEMAFNSPNWWTTKSSRVPDTAGLDSGKMTKVETQSIRLSSVWGWEVGWGKSKKVETVMEENLGRKGFQTRTFFGSFFVKGPVFVDTYSIQFVW